MNQLHLVDLLDELTKTVTLTKDRRKEIEEGIRDGADCELCSEWSVLPIVTPCAHLLCLECTAKSGTACPKCSNAYKLGRKGEPKDLIELQPNFSQEAWKEDWINTVSTKLLVLTERLRSVGAVTFWDRKKKAFVEQKRKIIVFCQFLEHAALIAGKLKGQKIPRVVHVRSMAMKDRMHSLHEFENNPDVGVLITDRSAAVGHDFSFVTHIFIMEPIWDQSMELQVISRAHRIGAKEKITVEKFAIQKTIEEEILQYSPMDEESSTFKDKEAVENLRRSFILSNLTMIPTKELQDAPTDQDGGTDKDEEAYRWGWFSNS